MNIDFSIDTQIESIQNPRTKGYFKEVHQTLINGNYRSSIVMLYSVLICDLVFKLRDLRDIYSDSSAKNILEDIEAMQVANPKSPEWENRLIELIKERTSLLEPGDIIAIDTLQKLRHLSAHPILSAADILFTPTKENVQSCVRSMLEGILTKPPFFSNKIFNVLLEDLADIKDTINGEDNLSSYLKSRYLNRLKETDLKKLFRSLWRIVFVTDDVKSRENRAINYFALNIILHYNKGLFIELIKTEKAYYSNITKDAAIKRLIRFLARQPDVYNNLEASIQYLINDKVALDEDSKLLAWFLKPTLSEHLKVLKPNDFTLINEKTIKFLHKLAQDNLCEDDILKFLIGYLGTSDSFSTAAKRFEEFIEPYVDSMGHEIFKTLLNVANTNSQVYGRFGIVPKLLEVTNRKFDGKINKVDYANVFSSKDIQ